MPRPFFLFQATPPVTRFVRDRGFPVRAYCRVSAAQASSARESLGFRHRGFPPTIADPRRFSRAEGADASPHRSLRPIAVKRPVFFCPFCGSALARGGLSSERRRARCVALTRGRETRDCPRVLPPVRVREFVAPDELPTYNGGSPCIETDARRCVFCRVLLVASFPRGTTPLAMRLPVLLFRSFCSLPKHGASAARLPLPDKTAPYSKIGRTNPYHT